MRSLTLALERAEHIQQLTAQCDLLDTRTLVLSDANEELEAFAYSVSHDLRTPGRHIAGFSQLLRTSLKDQLTDQSTRYLTIIEQAARRMNGLIDSMLDLARTSQQPLQLQGVGLDALLTDIQAELEPDVQGRTITWQVNPLPRVMADQDLLRQVLQRPAVTCPGRLSACRVRAQCRFGPGRSESRRCRPGPCGSR
ncbi:histidine kinase dimerization/phospho-acceptor domain-containing protein [Deinococcus sp. Arct2-2]|uniref:sensor histidine kinase n=1 Tax=Deinococcus sp. Arct2-2 TaxID=2568653 RepID=UPI001F0D56BE|nr:histidine kinase dimerization/phospho-acceptor domain-containing protein [Deinococcus sp. Arct2-2]